MRLYFYGFIMLFERFVLRHSTGQSIRRFAEHMGVVYIKFAQILAMQNVGQLFTESDRAELATICDHCNPIEFAKIKQQLESEYKRPLTEIFRSIDEEPLGSASISQVHRAQVPFGIVRLLSGGRKTARHFYDFVLHFVNFCHALADGFQRFLCQRVALV